MKLKDYYNSALIAKLSQQVKQVHPPFDCAAFEKDANKGLSELEMRPRSKHISVAFYTHLGSNYATFLEIAKRYFNTFPAPEKVKFEEGILYELFANIAEAHGTHVLDENLFLFREITTRFTAEFLIRPFLIEYPKQLIPILIEWSKDENHHIRRLCSEGTRPLLPWGKKLHAILEHPEWVFPILHNLIEDESKYVQKSVANHLNDVSKNQLDAFYGFLNEYKNHPSESVQWIIKHALRSEIKNGNPKALQLIGINPTAENVQATLAANPNPVRIGDNLELTCSITNQAKKPQELVIDYAVHFMRANGSNTAKVFKWTRKTLASGEAITLAKKHSFKLITTRKYYPGNHTVDILVNGKVLCSESFELTD